MDNLASIKTDRNTYSWVISYLKAPVTDDKRNTVFFVLCGFIFSAQIIFSII